jgi:hypothetical protein
VKQLIYQIDNSGGNMLAEKECPAISLEFAIA